MTREGCQLLLSNPSKSRFGWEDLWLAGKVVGQSRGRGGSLRSNLKKTGQVPDLLSRIKSSVERKKKKKDKTNNYFCRAAKARAAVVDRN